MALAMAPRERAPGTVQRITYLHVPAAGVGYLAFGVALGASLAVPWRQAASADRLAHASGELAAPPPHG